MTPIVYRIDAGNRIVHVNDTWSDFARNNDGDSVMPEHVLGRDLLDWIGDMTLRELYARMIERVRGGQTLHFPYRCDAPDRRRTFDMEIRLLADGQVEFASTLQHESPRAAVAVLERGRRRDARLLKVCSWCQQVQMPDNSWMPVEAAVETLHLLEAETFPELTHGICAACLAQWHFDD